jgi:hypothetical protein
MIHLLLDLDSGILFNIFFTITAVLRDRARREIDVVADNSGTPGGREKLGKCAIASLISSQRCNKRVTIERRHINSSRFQRRALGKHRPVVCQIQALACGKGPEIARHACPPKCLRQIRESSDLRPTSHTPLQRHLQVIDSFANGIDFSSNSTYLADV